VADAAQESLASGLPVRVAGAVASHLS
jgi:hypothetical protein